MKKISQREARRLKKRVEELESQRAALCRAWARDFPGGVHLLSMPIPRESRGYGRLEAAQMLGRVLVAKLDDELRVYAVAP